MVTPMQILMVEIDPLNMWQMQYFWAMCVVLLVWLFKKPIPWSVFCLWAYVIGMGIFFFEYPSQHFGVASRSFQVTAGKYLLEIIFIPMLTFYFDCVIPYLLTPLALWACFSAWMHWPGFLNAPSVHLFFAAICVPFIPWWGVAAVAITCLFNHGMTALTVLAGNALIFIFTKKDLRVVKKVGLVVLLGLGIFASMKFHQQGTFFGGNGRIEVWKSSYDLWEKNWTHIILGFGSGTWMWCNLIQKGLLNESNFLQMHSDVLQIGFEFGLVGLALSFWVFIHAVKRNWQNPRMLMGISGVVISAITYYPLHHFPTALLAAWIFKRALIVKEVKF